MRVTKFRRAAIVLGLTASLAGSGLVLASTVDQASVKPVMATFTATAPHTPTLTFCPNTSSKVLRLDGTFVGPMTSAVDPRLNGLQTLNVHVLFDSTTGYGVAKGTFFVNDAKTGAPRAQGTFQGVQKGLTSQKGLDIGSVHDMVVNKTTVPAAKLWANYTMAIALGSAGHPATIAGELGTADNTGNTAETAALFASGCGF